MKLRWCCFFLLATLIYACQSFEDNNAILETEPEIHIPDGFTLEELFRPSETNMGTWVSLAEGPDSVFFACDQWGEIYSFKNPAIGKGLDSHSIQPLGLDIGHAHGMMWAFNSLYVAVNRRWSDEIKYGDGVYRLTDQDGDGQLDNIKMLLKLDGAGEHGPHSFKLSPDGQEIYFIAGNHTTVPDVLKNNSRLPNHWGEDNLLPTYPDARGHAVNIKAPGGWIAKTDPDGQAWELIAAGFRNAFDIAFNDHGELFAFDADMEWDFGMPWYRPIRICHATSGAEFGWRTGSGKWPTYYPDALPSVVDLGQGSPTALLNSSDLDFPNKYKNGLFAADWSFGTMYFVSLEESGSSYVGKKEEFLYGIPLPLTDVIAGTDGHMYFATGGRNLSSSFYRLRFTGSKIGHEIEKQKNKEAINLRTIRQELEALHTNNNKNEVSNIWQYLDHTDRHIRYAARIALEHQPVDRWEIKYFREKNDIKTIEATIALIRCLPTENQLQNKIIDKLRKVDWAGLNNQQTLDLLRGYELFLIRMKTPEESHRKYLLEKLNEIYPNDDRAINREISEILIFLNDPHAIEKGIALMTEHTEANTTNDVEMLSDEVADRHEDYGKDLKAVVHNMPPAEAISYAVQLSHAKSGWTKALRTQYFNWFYDVFNAEGGLSFRAFMENIRQQALTNVDKEERAYYQELSGVYSPAADMANLPQPKGPGKNYNIYDINGMLGGLDKYDGDLADGQKMFEAALCSSCHRMNGAGGNSGPDLTQIHTRFSRWDMVNAIFSPHQEISDQYAFTLFTMNDGSKKAGKIFSEDEEKVVILPNPYVSTLKTELKKNDIADRSLSPISPMPPGLLNRLNKEEIKDLFAYLLPNQHQIR